MCCSLVGKNHVCYDCIYRDFPQTAQPTLYALITLAFFIPPLSVDRSLPYDFTVLCSPKCLLLFLKFLVSCLISLCKKILVRIPGMFLGSLMNVCFLSCPICFFPCRSCCCLYSVTLLFEKKRRNDGY